MDPAGIAQLFLDYYEIVVFIALVGLGLSVGTITEKRHFKRLAAGEAELAHVRLSTLGRHPEVGPNAPTDGLLVTGEVAISSDFFKSTIATIIKFIGGEMKTYHSLMERARREAILRMVRQAHDLGYDAVCNIRITGVDISGSAVSTGNQKPVVMVAAVASGTAYKHQNP